MIEMTDELVRKCEGLIIKELDRFEKRQNKENTWRVDREDLKQEAYLAMAEACKRFDPDRGFEFSTYLVKCVDNAIMGYYRRISRPYAVSQEQNRVMVMIDKGIKAGKTIEEIAEENDVSQEKILENLNLNVNAYSLDYKVTNDKDGNQSNFADALNADEESVGENNFKDKLAIMIDSLKKNTKVSEKDKECYYRMKGLFERKPATLKQLAEEEGISVHKFRAHMQSVSAVLEHDVKKDIWIFEHIGMCDV